MSESKEWEQLKNHEDYEININYPHQIRRKKNERILKENERKDKYLQLSLNGKCYLKHRLIAEQWIENDDPENKIDIDHINRNRSDNHIENLRWVSKSENDKNKTSYNEKFTYFTSLPENATALKSYGNHELKNIFIDYQQKKVYVFNNIQYREIIIRKDNEKDVYWCKDVNNKRIRLFYNLLFKV